jgi:hypothetical protein
MQHIWQLWRMPLAAALIVVGFVQVWLPHPAAGLAQSGLELGEWVKFLPEVQQGIAPYSRNLLYLPPVTLGLALVLFSADWPPTLRTWLLRAGAVGVALLALPPLAVIVREPSSEWRLRLGWIVAVGLAALLAPAIGRWPDRLRGLLLVACGVAGGVWPTLAYWGYRPIISTLFAEPVGIGPGLWLNLAGHLLLIAIGLTRLRP